jgi:hypothetical protein
MGAMWTVKADARQKITAYGTQSEAIETARSLLAATGGGELVIRDSAGTVVGTELVAPREIKP